MGIHVCDQCPSDRTGAAIELLLINMKMVGGGVLMLIAVVASTLMGAVLEVIVSSYWI